MPAIERSDDGGSASRPASVHHGKGGLPGLQQRNVLGLRQAHGSRHIRRNQFCQAVAPHPHRRGGAGAPLLGERISHLARPTHAGELDTDVTEKLSQGRMWSIVTPDTPRGHGGVQYAAPTVSPCSVMVTSSGFVP